MVERPHEHHALTNRKVAAPLPENKAEKFLTQSSMATWAALSLHALEIIESMRPSTSGCLLSW